ncbi:hypothetical protein FKM82_027749 [Ascaphus truei]
MTLAVVLSELNSARSPLVFLAHYCPILQSIVSCSAREEDTEHFRSLASSLQRKGQYLPLPHALTHPDVYTHKYTYVYTHAHSSTSDPCILIPHCEKEIFLLILNLL